MIYHPGPGPTHFAGCIHSNLLGFLSPTLRGCKKKQQLGPIACWIWMALSIGLRPIGNLAFTPPVRPGGRRSAAALGCGPALLVPSAVLGLALARGGKRDSRDSRKIGWCHFLQGKPLQSDMLVRGMAHFGMAGSDLCCTNYGDERSQTKSRWPYFGFPPDHQKGFPLTNTHTHTLIELFVLLGMFSSKRRIPS